jgi:hypothetical protein
MYSSDKYELIDKFLSNQLSNAEQTTFDGLMIKDPDFTNQVEKMRITNTAIHQLGLLETTKKLNQLHQKKTNAKAKFRVWATSAAFLSIGIYGLYNFTTEEQPFTVSKPNSTKTSTKSTVNNDIKTNTNKEISKISPSVVEEQKSPVAYDDSERIEQINTTTKKDFVDTTLSNEFSLTTTKDTSNLVSSLMLDETENKTTYKESTINISICKDITLTEYRTEPSCIGKQNGELVFSNEAFSGGFSPYKTFIYRLGDEENFLDKNQLQSGEYSIKVVDAKGCVDTVSNITIIEKRCLQRLDESFSPAYGESWQYPKIPDISEYTVIIKDMANNIILEKQVSLNEESEWQGELENGTIIKKGIYFIEIKNGNEVFSIGSMTIID